MMVDYKVSILIPVYKSSAFIERCAESVFAQTFESIEYVFVDDCSPDDSIEKLNLVINNYPQRKENVKIIRCTENKGISGARQMAFDAANGRYFLAMDSDDWIEPDMIEVLYNQAIIDNSEIVYSSYFIEFAENNRQIVNSNFTRDKKQLVSQIFFNNSAYWNKLISLDLIKKYGIKTIQGVDYGDDLVVLVKAVYYAKVISAVSRPLYHYNQCNTNSVTKNFTLKHIDDRIKVVKNVDEFFKEQQDYRAYEILLLRFKASRKIKIIRLTRGEKSEYFSLYPELNRNLIKLGLPFKSLIILYLSANNRRQMLKIFLNGLRYLDKKIRR